MECPLFRPDFLYLHIITVEQKPNRPASRPGLLYDTVPTLPYVIELTGYFSYFVLYIDFIFHLII